MCKVAIAGGGASGMLAAILLAERGYNPVIYEKNDRLGKKLFITGKGRCNLTNNCSVEELFDNVVTNPKFLYSAFYGFDAEKTIKFFEKLGLTVKTERGGRVFPVSDHSSDVISVLSTRLKRLDVEVHLCTEVLNLTWNSEHILTQPDAQRKPGKDLQPDRYITGLTIRTADGKQEWVECTHVVVATGGVSYPLTGSTGDGLQWGRELGLEITEPRPALVPMNVREAICRELMGLSLKNIGLSFVAEVKGKDKIVYSDMGEMLFTHFGVSGPVILSASSYLGRYLDSNLRLYLDFKPALSDEQLDSRLLRDFSENMNKQFRNSLGELLPKRMIPHVIERSGINPYQKVNIISRTERQNLIRVLKHFELHVESFRGFDEAIITQGGIKVKEINPGTMESKHVKGLYFVGEVIDVDALTGGYNLQIAWSTAATCAEGI